MARYPKNSSPKLTKDLIVEITSAIKSGAYVETAVACCGISKDTFYRWLRQAKSGTGNELHRELSDAVTRAFAEATMRDLQIIDRAAKGVPESFVLNEDGTVAVDEFGSPIVEKYKIQPDWRVAAWRLERRCPRQWGTNSKGVMAELDDFNDEFSEERNQFKVVFVNTPHGK